MKEQDLIERGFVSTPHLVLSSSFMLDIGRNRSLSVSCLGTPNEMVFLNHLSQAPKGITDCICMHNYDYDGYLTVERLDLIMSIFNKQ